MRDGVLLRIASAVVALGIAVPSAAVAQVSHAQAKAEVEARDAKKHNKLKTEGVPTATGAVAGGVAGGPAGAFAGAKIGHATGSGFHAIKKHRDIKRVEKHGVPPDRAEDRVEDRTVR